MIQTMLKKLKEQNYKIVFQLFFFFILSINAIAFLIVRKTPLGADSYAFYLKTCGQFDKSFTTIAANIMFNSIPCNIQLFNTIAFLFFCLYLFIIFHIIKLYYPEKAWKIINFIWLVPTFQFLFYQFEDAALGTICLTAILYFYLKGRKKMHGSHSFKNGVIGLELPCITMIIFVGLFIWRWALLYLFVFSFTSIIAMASFIIIIGVFGFNNVFGSLFPFFDVKSNLIWENLIGISVLTFFLIMMGFFYQKKEFNKVSYPFLISGILTSKFMYQGIVFLLMGFYEFLIIFDFKIKMLSLGFYKRFKQIVVFSAIYIILIGQYNSVINAEPTGSTFELLNYSIQLSKDTNIPLNNEWGVGYWLKYLGKDTNSYGGFHEWKDDFNHSLVISMTERKDCLKVKKGNLPLEITLYYCP